MQIRKENLRHISAVVEMLEKAYWFPIVYKTRERLLNSLIHTCDDNYFVFSDTEVLVGFGRIITDGVSFGYLTDVFIKEEYRGKGTGARLIDFIFEDNKHLERIIFSTSKDNFDFYKNRGCLQIISPQEDSSYFIYRHPSD